MNIAAKYFNQHDQIIKEIPFNVTKLLYIGQPRTIMAIKNGLDLKYGDTIRLHL